MSLDDCEGGMPATGGRSNRWLAEVGRGAVPFDRGPNGRRIPPAPRREYDLDPNLAPRAASRDVHSRLMEGRQCAGSAFHTALDPMDWAVALADCDGCPVKAECLQVVDPRRSWFDGVCAGQAWMDGRPVDVALMGQAPLHPEIPMQQVDEAQPDLLAQRLKGLRPGRDQ